MIHEPRRSPVASCRVTPRLQWRHRDGFAIFPDADGVFLILRSPMVTPFSSRGWAGHEPLRNISFLSVNRHSRPGQCNTRQSRIGMRIRSTRCSHETSRKVSTDATSEGVPIAATAVFQHRDAIAVLTGQI